MSMNLGVRGFRKAVARNAKNKEVVFVDYIYFDLWQTPSKITRECMSQDSTYDCMMQYIDWAFSIGETFMQNIYEDDDPDNEVIGRIWVDPANDHCLELTKFILKAQEDGYKIEFFEQ